MPIAPEQEALALDALRAGQWSRAEHLYRQVVASDRQHAQGWHLLGVALIHSGRPGEALDCIQRALALQPDDAGFHLNYGVALRLLDRRDEAIACFQAALARNPHLPHAHNNVANAFYEGGNHTQAIVHWQKALAIQPANAEAGCNLAQALGEEGKLDDALSHIQETMQRLPKNAPAHRIAGNVRIARKEFSEAEACFRQALRLRPEWPEAHCELAQVLRRQNKLTEAATHLRQALQLHPNCAPAHNEFGILRGQEGQPEEAILHFEKALTLRPGYVEAHHNLAVVLRMQRRFAEAAEHLGRVVPRYPDAVEPVTTLAGILDQMGRSDEAIALLRVTQQRQPGRPELLVTLGTTLANAGQMGEAVACFREAVRLKPEAPLPHSCLLDALNYDPLVSSEELLAEHRNWERLHAQASRIGPRPDHDRDLGRRLRIGYVSSDLIRHIAAYFIQPIFAHHDSAQVETFVYADVPAPDASTARFWSLIEHWRNVCALGDVEVARLVQEDRIDILVDLGGHTSSRLGVFARQVAPVQITYLGYPNTTGLSSIHYRLTDDVTDPPGEPVCHAEELIRLPGGFSCYAPPTDVPDPGPLPALQSGFLTFGSLHKLPKLNDRVLDLWAAILRALPSSRLLLFRNNLIGQVRENLRRRFFERGIEAGRLIFPSMLPPNQSFLSVYRDVDIALDCFPWSGHATACEGMWMGVPILTLRGNRHAGRMVAGLLTQLGMKEWIAETPEHYVVNAIGWQARLPELAKLRAELRGHVASSSLCDGASFTRQLEATYRTLWERWVRAKS